MRYEKLDMSVEGSVGNPTLTLYLQDASEEIDWKERPLILICPGGGYCFVSDREAEPFAMQFLAMGYHAAILHYSVAPAVYPTQILEAAKAVALLRGHAKEWNIDSKHIFIQGCSAGGHLAASYCCFWQENWVAEKTGVPISELKPNGLILCYPVISSGEYAHRDSFVQLLGDRYEELLERVSLEKQVNEGVPPVFMWHTITDDCVPVENSFYFISALHKHKIPVEFHMFPEGGHGLSLANKLSAGTEWKEEHTRPNIAVWIDLVHTWIEGLLA